MAPNASANGGVPAKQQTCQATGLGEYLIGTKFLPQSEDAVSRMPRTVTDSSLIGGLTEDDSESFTVRKCKALTKKHGLSILGFLKKNRGQCFYDGDYYINNSKINV